MNMLIKKVTLKNFRQYREEQTIEFAADKEKNVTMVYGEMGCGKSNLFSAINWCLYGESGSVENESEIINKAALSEGIDGDAVETVVKVEFRHDSKSYYCIRTLKAKNVCVSRDKYGNERFTYFPETESPFLGIIQGTGEVSRVADAAETINSILPSQMRKYFFFDGEKIDELSKPGHEGEVKKGIEAVLQLHIITRGINHLKQVCKDYDAALERYSKGEVKELYRRRSEINSEIDNLEEKQSGLQNEHSEAKKLISTYNTRLLELGEIKDQVEQRDKLENRLKDLNNESEELELKMKKETTKAFIVLSEKIRKKTHEIVSQKRQKGEIPTGIRETFLRDLLEERICICGRRIEPDSSEETAIKRRLSHVKPGELENLIIELPGKLNLLSTEAGSIVNSLKTLRSEKTNVRDEIDGTVEDLQHIHESLKDTEHENISNLESERDDAMKRLGGIEPEITKTSGDIDKKERELKNIDEKIERAEINEKRGKELKKRGDIAEKSRNVLKKINNKFIQEMRKEIQEYSQDIFGSLIWKSSQFKDVSISDKFELEVLDRWGKPARRELSAGERQCFSLAFILAMSEATEAEAPFIMDTPFARISEDPLRNISEKLPNLTKQLVLLVTNKEFPVEYSDDIKPRVGRVYKLHFNDATGCTTIEEEGL